MNLHLIRSKKFKTTTICFLIRRGLNRDEVTANALIPNILKRGSMDYSSLQKVYEKTEDMYGAVFDAVVVKKGEEQLLQFFIEVVNEDLSDTPKGDLVAEAFSFLNSIIFRPLVTEESFDEAIVNLEKENLRKIIRARVNDKKEYARLRVIEETCKDEAFGIYADGYLKDIDALNGNNLYEQYKKVIGSSAIEVVVIGNEEEDKLKKYLNNFDLKTEKEKMFLIRPLINPEKKNEHVLFERMDISQSKLCVTLRTESSDVGSDYYALLLANEILGGGSNSKLFMNARERESLCYYISSALYRSKPLILIQAGIEAENFDKIIAIIKEEIDKLKNAAVKKEELDNAKQSLANKFKAIEDYASATMDFYLGQYLMNDTDTLEDLHKNIESVSLEEVSAQAKNLWIDTVYLLGRK